ncbi:MAG: hypothetical protein ACRDI2_09235 [Chloroflexota bacterium]
MSGERYRPGDIIGWVQHTDRQIFLADVKDSSNSESMSIWFGRYGAGAQQEWTVTYDEVIVVAKGRFTVRDENGAKTAGPGEVLVLTRGTRVTCSAEEVTELVGATYLRGQSRTGRTPSGDLSTPACSTTSIPWRRRRWARPIQRCRAERRDCRTLRRCRSRPPQRPDGASVPSSSRRSS